MICHEAFRYPEITRSLVLGGAQVIFVPHFVTTDDGSLPSQWCAASNPYNEKAVMLRALENTVYVAASNNAGTDQGSASVISPEGELIGPCLRASRRRRRRSRPSACPIANSRGAGRQNEASSNDADSGQARANGVGRSVGGHAMNEELCRRLAQLKGSSPLSWQRIERGYTPAERWLVRSVPK